MMTTTEKNYVATLVAFMCANSQTSKSVQCFGDTCRELGVSANDIQRCVSRGPSFKTTMYETLSMMSPSDKKQAQQYFVKAALADGSNLSAFILNEVLEECQMFDHVI